MKRLLAWLWKYFKPFTNWRFLISFGIAWIITNGMWYVIAFVPMNLPDWVVWIAISYVAFLYMPWTPEKLITIPMAIFIQTQLFKNDKKTKAQLQEMYSQAKSDWRYTKIKILTIKQRITLKMKWKRYEKTSLGSNKRH
ncbi:MAG: hypothetical protein M0R51_08980 [Clostridia bacterium]|jgi:hypothetical protein|nr:hypothetical protein [Clostridia bacterium]